MNAQRHLLSISHLTALNAMPPELVSAAAGAGFDAVGIRVWPAADEPAYPMLDDTPMMHETLARLAETGIRVLDVEVLRLRPDSRHDAERGMRACLEFMIFSSVKTLADAVRVLDRTAHPAAAILVDALHMQRSGATPLDLAAVPPAWLPYAQLCDGSVRNPSGHPRT